ncbi:SprB repeat-containing protein, partial [Aureispira]|nr:SprB repeat-containing protein [Aureispira sp.]
MQLTLRSLFFKLILIGCTWFSICTYTFATHYTGFDLTYSCIGPNQYLVTLNVFRDCNGVSVGGTQVINYSSASCGVNASLSLTSISVTDITPLCPSQSSACNGGSGSVGVERHVFQGTLTLPPGCNDWVLSSSSCCRNNAITNLSSPGSNDIYVETTLNNTLTPCNSSPFFTYNPQLFACVGQAVNYQQLATDSDGDSLVYSMTNCLQGAGTSVSYAGGFSGANPLTNPVTINSQTGEISFTPTQAQVAVMCVLVEEYRNGVLISTIMRDIQFNITNCNNTIPAISGINGSLTVFDTSICEGGTLCFDILSSDVDPGNNVTLTFSNNIPGAFFTQNTTGGSVAGTFCWTTAQGDLGTYVFAITAEDDACPILGQNAQSYTIVVGPNPNPPVSAGNPVQICAGDTTLLTATTTANPPLAFEWTPTTNLLSPNAAATFATPTTTTSYTVALTYADGCISTDAVTVYANTDPLASIFPSTGEACGGANYVLTGSSDLSGMNFEWFDATMTSLGTGTISGSQSTIAVSVPVTPGTYPYILEVTNPNTGCLSTDTGFIIVGVPPVLPSCVNIYVSTTGTTGGAGTQADPTTIAEGLNRAACNNAVLKIATGTYNLDNALNLGSFTTLEGGFDQANGWQKTSVPGATTINRTTANPEGVTNSQRIVTFYGNGVIQFRLQDLTISTSNSNIPGMSTYGLHLNGCSNYEIVRCDLQAGNGGDGDGDDNPSTYNAAWDGQDGFAGSAGNVGSKGNSTTGLFGVCTGDNGGNGGSGGSGGAGGANATPIGGTAGGGTNGGNGGNGSDDDQAGNCSAGSAGNSGAGAGGGSPGSGGPQDGSNSNGPTGGTGGTGADGTNGTNGITIPSNHTGLFFAPSYGTNGTAGTGSFGGGGGGGGGCDDGGCKASGGGGSGGSGGAGGGGAGAGAFGGGGSFPLYIVNGAAGGQIIDSDFNSGAVGNAGIGGLGGASDATSGTGASPGSPCANGDSDCNKGGAGGSSGISGIGGDGGDGTAGDAFGIHVNGTAPSLTQNGTTQSIVAGGNNPINFNLAAQPIITAENINCTNTNVDFNAPSSVTWDFSSNATPQSPTGTSATTQFGTIARNDIIAGADTYTGFHNISFSNTITPTILTNAPVIGPDTFMLCDGDFATFQSQDFADSYNWKFNGAIPNPGNVQDITSQFNTPGFYLVTLSMTTDCCGLTPEDSIYLYVSPIPNPTGSGNVTICDGEATLLTLTGLGPTDSVVWTPTTDLIQITSGSALVSPSTTSVFNATVYSTTNTGNEIITSCPTLITFIIFVNPSTNLSFTTVDPTCNDNGSITSNVISPSGTYNFTWSTSFTDLGVVTSTLTGLSVGSYTVTATQSSTGCTAIDTINLYPGAGAPSIFLQTSTSATCGQSDGTATLSTVGGTGTLSYVWNDAFVGPSRTGLPGGTYSATVTDGVGCTSSVIFDVTEQSPLDIIFIDSLHPVCANSGALEIEANGGTPTVNYLWSNSETTTLVTGLNPGTYTVTATDVNGCSATAGFTLVSTNSSVNPIATSTLICPDDTTGIIVNAIVGNAPFTYTWTGGSSASFPPNLDVVTGATGGTYNVTVTDASGNCTATGSVSIAAPAAFSIQLDSSDIACFGDGNGTATVNINGGAPIIDVLWSAGAQITNTISNLNGGTYVVTVTDNNNCVLIDSTIVNEPPSALSPTITDSINVSCFGGNNGLATITPNGGTSPYSYIWTNNQTDSTANTLIAGVYTVTTTDNNNCSVTSTIT